MSLESVVMLVHAAVTWSMVGLIWFVQVVHYPLFSPVGSEQFVAYGREHRRRTSGLVAPLMLAELATALWLAFASGPETRGLAWSGVALVLGIWLTTFLVQVPCHRRLAMAFDEATIEKLVRTNWIRTSLWTGRGLIAVAFLAMDGR